MDIDWGIVLIVACCLHLVTSLIVITLQLSSLDFWKEVQKKEGGKLHITVMIGMSLLPIVAQLGLYVCISEAYQTLKEKISEDAMKEKMRNRAILPVNLEALIDRVIEKEDYEITSSGRLYNKALMLSIGKDRIEIEGREYRTDKYEMKLLNILHQQEYSNTYKMYRTTRGA